MTAEPVPALRVVTVERSRWGWPPGYLDALTGTRVRMPALVERGRVLAGYLVAVRETEDVVELTFSGLAPED